MQNAPDGLLKLVHKIFLPFHFQAGLDVLVVQDVLNVEAESQRVLTVDIPVLADAGIERISRVELLLASQVFDVAGRHTARDYGVGTVDRAHREIHVVVIVEVGREVDVVVRAPRQADVDGRLGCALDPEILPVDITVGDDIAAVVLRLQVIGVRIVGILSPAHGAVQGERVVRPMNRQTLQSRA